MERREHTPHQLLWRLWMRIRPLGRKSALRPGTERNLLPHLSARASHVLDLAREEAHRLGHPGIGPEHLLLGLIRERKGLAVQAFHELYVDLDDVRHCVEEHASVVEGSAALGEGALTTASRRVVDLAVDEARRLRHPYVGTEHLLLGVICHEENAGAAALRELGVTEARAWAATEAVIHRRVR